MQNGTHPSWSLVTDAPADLNFAMYVACSFNIIPETTPFVREQIWSARRVDISDKDELRILTEQWLRWWKDIVKDRADNQLHGRWSRYYTHDGQFVALEEPLRGRCEAVFPSFNEWWGLTAGGQQGVNFWDKVEEFRPIVKQVEHEVGRAAQPFQLMVDYLYTGLGQIVEVTSSYAVMSVHRPELSVGNSDWWLEKVRELA
jgi:hypothetical protein